MSGLIAKFASSEQLIEAVKRCREAGYDRIDTFTPYPIPELTRLLGGQTSAIGWIAAAAALTGGALTYALIYWSAVLGYPLNIGGRPIHSWPAFIPAVLVAAALWSGLATLLATLWMAGLPRWHDPLFDIHQFDRATYDKFFLLVRGDDPAFSKEETRRLLETLNPEHVDEVAS